MKFSSRIAALSGLLAVVDAKALKWQQHDGPSWIPAETVAVMDLNLGWSPAPTSAPEPKHVEGELRKRVRGTDTCAFVSGISTSSLYCDLGNSCIINSFISVVGCCSQATLSDCTIPTTCVPSSAWTRITTSESLTYWCGSSVWPSCVTYVYTGADYAGYTLFGCGKTATRITVAANPAVDSPVTSFSSSSSSSTSPDPISSTTTPAPGPTTTTPAPNPTPQASSNTGAIVGGVVGGIGGLALIGAGIFFLIRHRNKDNGPATPQPPLTQVQDNGMGGGPSGPQSMYGPPPPIQQPSPVTGYPPQAAYSPPQASYFAPAAGVAAAGGLAAGAAAAGQHNDPRYSTYDGSVSSPPGSPPPPGHSPINQYPNTSPVMQQQPPYGAYPPAQMPQQQPYPGYGQAPQQYPQYTGNTAYSSPSQPSSHPTHVSELPTTRGDRELQELA